ncbi:MAG: glycosyl hydrolase 115 family protein [Lachnospiraceae bacterium]|nr:glycosyl hydrolase 115 family protein [Lachnospiraceae bacterium]
MSTITLIDNNSIFNMLVEKEAFEGVKKIATKVLDDFCKVTGKKPKLVNKYDASTKVLIATLGNSSLLNELEEKGLFDRKSIENKREVYSISLIDNPYKEASKLLLICGSDKLGTIYGLFALSEYIGVTAMCDFGDVVPEARDEIIISKDIEIISKEPSVRYRGFFINDEWPCFGNWTFNHYNGFTAEMYDKVFEFLLRMKGNYLWPAMWTSSFCLDGPGSLSEELAHMYGITVAYSHHEPCLRASEEWDIVRGEDSIYGNEWNYYTNSEGLTRYWRDALIRSGKYGHMVTIGMRGERDSSMLGEEATLKDNIDLLKDIITTQRGLIKECINEDVTKVPQLLALYKEVEAYFYGDENTEGLCNWKELDDVIFMLCEDNFGHMRTLPTEEMRKHPGGFGMYYHLDYHGDPISYEWMPSTKLTTIWEQMSEAYDYGIKDIWIVNVGDLKGNEVALNYFLCLAYDFDKWGTNSRNVIDEYMKQWTKKNFSWADEETVNRIASVYLDFVELNAKRRPEALNASIYHPCNYEETDKILAFAADIERRNEELYSMMTDEQKLGYYSMIYYPAKTSINLVRMNLYATKNAHYAKQGRPIANYYGKLLAECIEKDRELSKEFGEFRDGKWKGMELEEHVGFTKWNDDGHVYPIRMYVEPVAKARLSVSRADDERICVKNYGSPSQIIVDDFMYEGNERVKIELSNDGIGTLDYSINIVGENLPKWLSISKKNGNIKDLEVIELSCDRSLLSLEKDTVELLVVAEDTTVSILVMARRVDQNGIAPMTFLPDNEAIVMEAKHFSSKKDVAEGAFQIIDNYGRSGSGLKVYPTTSWFGKEDDKPEVTYSFMAPISGDYIVEIWVTPTNSLRNGELLQALVCANNQTKTYVILDENYRGGSNRDKEWCRGALDQIRVTKDTFSFEKGLTSITIGAMEAGLVLERIVIYPVDKPIKKSYLGPKESYFVK